jgi:hypothetical protein
MMDFARSLAPLRDSDLTRALPVLPSRFGAEAPLSTAPSPHDEPEPGLPTPTEERPGAAARPSRASLVTLADDDGLRTQAVPAAPSSRRQAAATHQPQRLPADAELPAPAPPPASLRGRAAAERIDGAPSAASLPAIADPALIRQAPRVSAAAPRDGAAPPHVPRRPMSAPALAERHAAAAEPRPVVHVTIDRIDVRAPAAPARPAAAPRARNAAPSVSLADYLRQGGAKAGDRR